MTTHAAALPPHRSRRPLRVRWALEEAGAPYEYVVMSQEEGRGDEHARRHPLRRVPVLETDDGMLFESAALCLHVADLHPDAGLAPPPGTYERGQVYQWVSFAMTELEPAVLRLYLARRVADIVVGGVLESARHYDVSPDSRALRVYLERLDERPAKQRAYGS